MYAPVCVRILMNASRCACVRTSAPPLHILRHQLACLASCPFLRFQTLFSRWVSAAQLVIQQRVASLSAASQSPSLRGVRLPSMRHGARPSAVSSASAFAQPCDQPLPLPDFAWHALQALGGMLVYVLTCAALIPCYHAGETALDLDLLPRPSLCDACSLRYPYQHAICLSCIGPQPSLKLASVFGMCPMGTHTNTHTTSRACPPAGRAILTHSLHLGQPWAYFELGHTAKAYGLLMPLLIPLFLTTLTLEVRGCLVGRM